MYRNIFLFFFSLVSIISSAHNFTANQPQQQKKLIGSDHDYSKGPFFVIISASYQTAAYCVDYTKSVVHQDYWPNYCILYTEDNSDQQNETYTLIHEYLKKHKCEDRLIYRQNTERKMSLQNIYDMIHMCDPRTIAVMVDADDYLIDNSVLSYLAQVYADPNVWMTYGGFVWQMPDDKYYVGYTAQIPEDIAKTNNFRNYIFVFSHLKTFYSGLFHKIDYEDFLYNGKVFSVTGDLAFMLPMLEMSGIHNKHTEKISYIYNYTTPINDMKIKLEEQLFFDQYIRNKKRYTPVKSPF